VVLIFELDQSKLQREEPHDNAFVLLLTFRFMNTRYMVVRPASYMPDKHGASHQPSLSSDLALAIISSEAHYNILLIVKLMPLDR